MNRGVHANQSSCQSGVMHLSQLPSHEQQSASSLSAKSSIGAPCRSHPFSSFQRPHYNHYPKALPYMLGKAAAPFSFFFFCSLSSTPYPSPILHSPFPLFFPNSPLLSESPPPSPPRILPPYRPSYRASLGFRPACPTPKQPIGNPSVVCVT